MKKYSQKLLEYFYRLEHAGSLEGSDTVLTSVVGSIEQGGVVKLFLQIDNDVVSKIKFKTFGGVALIAASEFICHWAEGKRVKQLNQLAAADILQALGLPSLYNHVAVLVLNCLHQMLKGKI